MNREHEKIRNDHHRDQALAVIADNERRDRMRRTDELLLDREALRQASIRAGLEKPENH